MDYRSLGYPLHHPRSTRWLNCECRAASYTGRFSATVDEVTWVVTTYLVAAGIMISTTGWIAGQFGRKRYAASIYSMTRNIGGSIGTSVLTTMLVRKQQIQQSHLSEHVTVFSAWQMSLSPARMPGATPFKYMTQVITGQKQGFLCSTAQCRTRQR